MKTDTDTAKFSIKYRFETHCRMVWIFFQQFIILQGKALNIRRQ